LVDPVLPETIGAVAGSVTLGVTTVPVEEVLGEIAGSAGVVGDVGVAGAGAVCAWAEVTPREAHKKSANASRWNKREGMKSEAGKATRKAKAVFRSPESIETLQTDDSAFPARAKQNYTRRNTHVERIHASLHRNECQFIARFERAPRKSLALVAHP